MHPSTVSRKRRRPDSRRVQAAREGFYLRGESVRDWANARNYSPSTVYAILRGERACERGLAHKIAVDLGLKDVDHDGKSARISRSNHRKNIAGE